MFAFAHRVQDIAPSFLAPTFPEPGVVVAIAFPASGREADAEPEIQRLRGRPCNRTMCVGFGFNGGSEGWTFEGVTIRPSGSVDWQAASIGSVNNAASASPRAAPMTACSIPASFAGGDGSFRAIIVCLPGRIPSVNRCLPQGFSCRSYVVLHPPACPSCACGELIDQRRKLLGDRVVANIVVALTNESIHP